MPPAKVFITASIYELEVVTHADRRAIDLKVLEPNLVRRFFVIPGELVVRTLDFGLWTLDGCIVPQFKQSTFNLNHASYRLNGFRRRFDGRIELIAKQMLDVIDEQFLMLHLVLETEPNDAKDFFRIIATGKLLDESCHLFIDLGTI